MSAKITNTVDSNDASITSVFECVVPVVESYLRDFGLTDEQFIAVESRVLVGRAMSDLDPDATDDQLVQQALREAYERRDEWTFVAAREAGRPLWAGCSNIPQEGVVPMVRQRILRPRKDRHRAIRPAVT